MDTEQKIRNAAGSRQDRVMKVLAEEGLFPKEKPKAKAKKNAAKEGAEAE